MRQSFFKFLNEETQPFFFLSADVGYPFDQKLKSMISDRFINMGVAEKNMVSFACGLAQSEKVFCYSIGPFLSTYALPSIRNDLAYHQSNVCLVSCGKGFEYGSQGFTHHVYEDLNLLSLYPNITIYSPSSEQDLRHCMKEIMSTKAPSYLRLSRHGFLDLSWVKEERTGNPFAYKLVHGRRASILSTVGSRELIDYCLEHNIELIHLTKYDQVTLKKAFDLLSNDLVIAVEECLFPGPIFGGCYFKSLSMGKKILSINLDLEVDLIGSQKYMEENQSYPLKKITDCMKKYHA